MFDIISVGSATLDIFLKSPEFPLERNHIGAKIEVADFLMASGGGGSNAAAGFSRLGLSTACIARFGDDPLGEFVLADLEKESFEKKYLIEKAGDNTDCSVILVNPDGSRTILVSRGKTRIDESVFPWQALQETKWLYLASIEGNVDLLVRIIRESENQKIGVVLNPGSRELKEKEKLREIFPKLTALILNKQEAADFDLKEQADQGPEILVITNGRQGAKLFSEKESFFAEAFLGPVVDETGAGDAFSAGFVAGLVKGRPLAEALKLGMANGAAVVGQFGAKPGLLQEKEIDEWLKKDLRIEKLT